MSATIYQRVTDTILGQLAMADPTVWVCPWQRAGGGLPVNAFTSHRYRGINVLTFWAAARSADYPDDRWASFRQWAELGARVRKGEKGTICVFYKPLESRQGRDTVGTGKVSDRMAADDRNFVLRFSTVFNAAQVDDAPKAAAASADSMSAPEATPVFDRFVAGTGAAIVPGCQASYVPALDIIRMPPRDAFKSAQGYSATLSHEIVHWTAAKHRLDRHLKNRFGSRAYAAEELIAELGSAFVLAGLNLVAEPHPDHARYMASWLPLVKHDPRALFTAAAHAARAADWLTVNQLQSRSI